MEEEHYRPGPASENFFRRVSLPPAPDRRQRQPTPMYPGGGGAPPGPGGSSSGNGPPSHPSSGGGGG
eukprot:8482081-Pyramimonas_sp.AAC.1